MVQLHHTTRQDHAHARLVVHLHTMCRCVRKQTRIGVTLDNWSQEQSANLRLPLMRVQASAMVLEPSQNQAVRLLSLFCCYVTKIRSLKGFGKLTQIHSYILYKRHKEGSQSTNALIGPNMLLIQVALNGLGGTGLTSLCHHSLTRREGFAVFVR